MDIRSGIIEAANALGISPNDLATIISYETGGSFNPTQSGPTTKYGQHRGFIQFGEPQAQKYGINWSDPINSQLGATGAVVRYLKDAGVQPGMKILDIYSAVNTGRVGNYNARDIAAGGAPGSVAEKVTSMGPHQAKATALLGGQFQPSSLDTQSATLTSAFDPNEENPYQGMLDALNQSRLTADDQPRSMLADTLASSVGRREGSPGGLLPTASDQPRQEEAPPTTDFAQPATPQEAPSEASAPATIASDTQPLADVFKVASIGVPDEIDPYTGRAKVLRSRRAIG